MIGLLFSPAPSATPSLASTVATLPPAPADPGTEKQPRGAASTSGDPSPLPAAAVVAPLRPAVGGGLVSNLRRTCAVCGAEAGSFCRPMLGDAINFLVHRGRL